MQRQPIWGTSAWAGFVCALVALSALMHGQPAIGAVMTFGAVFLSGWAILLSRSRR